MRILVTGGNGQVGWELQRALHALGEVIAVDRQQLDLSLCDDIRNTVRSTKPDIVINTAAYTSVDKAESEPELAMRINAVAPGVMAEEAKRVSALLIHYSTDYVFDGMRAAPYTEDDQPNPLSVYGKSKLEGERAIRASGCAHLILRTSWIYSDRRTNFVLSILRLAQEREEFAVVDDQVGSPTWARALANSTAQLLSDPMRLREETGLYHLSAVGRVSRFDFATKIIEMARAQGETYRARIRRTATADYPLPAARPLNCVLSTVKIKRALGVEMPHWISQLEACLAAIRMKGNPL
jgi:dTDP-4-dehydrorhamnose reductase